MSCVPEPSGRDSDNVFVRARSAVGAGFSRCAAAEAAAYASVNRSRGKTQSTRSQGKVQWITFLCKEAEHTCVRLARRASYHDELRRIPATLGNMRKD
jgi:hypothetical protein